MRSILPVLAIALLAATPTTFIQAQGSPAPAASASPAAAAALAALEIHTIRFTAASARLGADEKDLLDDVALRMKQEPTATLIAIGYNDDKENRGPYHDLDRRRAEAVLTYLEPHHGIDRARITIEGRDGREPEGDNATEEGRLRNRRVVIRLMLP